MRTKAKHVVTQQFVTLPIAPQAVSSCSKLVHVTQEQEEAYYVVDTCGLPGPQETGTFKMCVSVGHPVF